MSPSSLSCLIWIKLHDMPMDWHRDSIASQIALKVGSILKIDKHSTLSGAMRSIKDHVMFNLANSLTLDV